MQRIVVPLIGVGFALTGLIGCGSTATASPYCDTVAGLAAAGVVKASTSVGPANSEWLAQIQRAGDLAPSGDRHLWRTYWFAVASGAATHADQRAADLAMTQLGPRVRDACGIDLVAVPSVPVSDTIEA